MNSVFRSFSRKALSLLAAASLLAGCSASTVSGSSASASSVKNSPSSETKTSQTVSDKASDQTGVSLLDDLVNASGDDAKAKDAWTAIFSHAADACKNTFELEGDGEVYEYKTADDSSFVKENFLYRTAREMYLAPSNENLVSAQYRILSNSYDEFQSGSGLFIRAGKDDEAFFTTLHYAGDESVKGTISSRVTTSLTEKDLPETMIYDAAISSGYNRPVDPVRNSSLYTYDLSEHEDGYKLVIKVKDLDAFHQAAASFSEAYDTLDDRPTLILNEVSDETYTMFFDHNGVLEESDINIFHALSSLGDKVYVNVRSKLDLDELDDDGEFAAHAEALFDEVADGTLKEGDEFTMED